MDVWIVVALGHEGEIGNVMCYGDTQALMEDGWEPDFDRNDDEYDAHTDCFVRVDHTLHMTSRYWLGKVETWRTLLDDDSGMAAARVAAARHRPGWAHSSSLF